jgi:hypothetical protein
MVCHQNDKIKEIQLADEPSCNQEQLQVLQVINAMQTLSQKY